VSGRALRSIAQLAPHTARRLADLADAERLSGRGTERLLRVARTVADLAASVTVEAEHLEQAARWRPNLREPVLALAV
jgi:magnesium chelatase family protein